MNDSDEVSRHSQNSLEHVHIQLRNTTFGGTLRKFKLVSFEIKEDDIQGITL